MDLWIRSQDNKKLIKADKIQILEEKDDKEFPFYIHNSYDLLGAYASEKRALEILDEIQNIINAKTIIKFQMFVSEERVKQVKKAIDKNSIIELPDYDIKQLVGVIVYEMPRE